jgi:hypothetical protein
MTSSSTYTVGGIEYFNPSAYGGGSSGGGSSGGGSSGGGSSLYGGSGGGGVDKYGMNLKGALTDIDYMRDAKLAEDRARAAENRERVLVDKIKAIEAEAGDAMRCHLTPDVAVLRAADTCGAGTMCPSGCVADTVCPWFARSACRFPCVRCN